MGNVSGHQHNPNRDKHDFYPTDPRWAEVLFRHESFVGGIHEPCAGDGAISDVIKKSGYGVLSSDINPRRCDVMKVDVFDVVEFDNVITNPPYNILLKVLDHFGSRTNKKLALLVRLNFLEAKTRLKWTTGENKPKKVIIVAGRMPVFGKVSQFPHCWVIWDFESNHISTELLVDTI